MWINSPLLESEFGSFAPSLAQSGDAVAAEDSRFGRKGHEVEHWNQFFNLTTTYFKYEAEGRAAYAGDLLLQSSGQTRLFPSTWYLQDYIDFHEWWFKFEGKTVHDLQGKPDSIMIPTSEWEEFINRHLNQNTKDRIEWKFPEPTIP
jgi:hypothetical protein